MIKRPYLCVLLLPLLYLSVAEAQQYPILDMIANKVIQKYQQSTCEQLWQKKTEKAPPSEMEQKAIQALKNDPQMRTAFINKVAAPIANKMFQCGLIPCWSLSGEFDSVVCRRHDDRRSVVCPASCPTITGCPCWPRRFRTNSGESRPCLSFRAVAAATSSE